jgi:hypothetical protein
MVTCIAFQHLASIVVIFHKQNPGTQFVAILVPWGSADWPGAVYPASTSPATPSSDSVIASGSQVHNSGSLYMDVGTPTAFSNHQHYRRRRSTSLFLASYANGNSLEVTPHQALSATSQQYFSLRTNQPPATSQQYSSLRTNQHQPSATSQPNRRIASGISRCLACPTFTS